MTILIRELLKDYGSACSSIGEYLIVNNCSSISQIQKGTNLDPFHIHLALSVLIQRRIVSFVNYENKTLYKIESKMILKRLFYNMYVRYIYDRFDSHRSFLKILVSGISKIDNCKENVQPLVQQGIIKEMSINDLRYGVENKNNKRDTKMFYSVDFDILDNLIVDLYVSNYLKKRYSKSMQEIYKSICKCTVITTTNILDNLQSTKILIKDGITYINDVNNIGEYLKYLCNLGIVRKDFDGDEGYKKKIDRSLDLIKIEQLTHMFRDTGARRLLNLFYNIDTLPDSEILRKALLPSSQVKKSIVLLHKYGCINLEYPTASNDNGKHPSLWRFNSSEYTKVIETYLENEMGISMQNINKYWDTGNIFENESFLIEISKIHFFSEKYFLFSMRF